ncbi:MAG: serine protease, partial [Bacteroidetes bacterium]|nr:serine protease [Bacteroidota bacterium]
MKKSSLLLVLLAISLQTALRATEGMWLPLLLSQLNEAEMRSMGMKMSAEDIYSVNKGSLKDAIVRFGGGCTGEVISNEGLLLTNHHCGYGRIQSHSSLENNYLEDGFWAMSKAEELPNPGLTATFIIRIEDVTETVMRDLTDDMPAKERQARIDQRLQTLKQSADKEDYQDAM